MTVAHTPQRYWIETALVGAVYSLRNRLREPLRRLTHLSS